MRVNNKLIKLFGIFTLVFCCVAIYEFFLRIPLLRLLFGSFLQVNSLGPLLLIISFNLILIFIFLWYRFYKN